MSKKYFNQKGQSLIEILIGIGVGILFISATIGILVLTLRIHFQSQHTQAAGEYAHGLAERLSTIASADWHSLFNLTRGTSTLYSLVESGDFFAVASGSSQIELEGLQYTHWFTVEDVYRDATEQIVSSSGTLDPSTLKITANLSWVQGGDTANLSLIRYLVRNKNEVFHQTDWSGAGGQEGPITSTNNRYATSTNIEDDSPAGSISIQNLSTQESSSTGSNIDEADYWAWNDVIGWIDFKTNNTVVVSSTGLFGYASSSVGELAFDCSTSPTADCTIDYGVENDGSGNLSGWAWNDVIGWISFSSDSGVVYQVSVDEDGYFSGWAWNDVIGWISFNCSNEADCANSDYKVKTTWSVSVIQATLTSSIFDTQVSLGSALNTIMWQGSKPTETSVKFQIASSNNLSGPWNYVGPNGTDSTYYEPAGPNLQTKITRLNHNNHRYIRYKVILESDPNKTLSPRVDDIIINWSP